jgi:hypothetical protein
MRPFLTDARRALPLLLAAGLAACHARDELTYAKQAPPPPPPAQADGRPAFVGRWAAARTACGHDAWSLDGKGLVSPSVLSCSFDRVDPTDAGYTAIGICTAGKAKAPGRLVLTLTQGSRALTLSGGPFAEPVALVRCTDDGQMQARATPAVTSAGG